MECQTIINLLSEYLDGLLPDNEQRRVAHHLHDCARCQTYEMQLSGIRLAARELPLHTPPRALWVRISNTIESEANTAPVRSENRITVPLAESMNWWERFKTTFSLPQLVGASALATLLIAFGSVTMYQQMHAPQSLQGMQASMIILQEEGKWKSELDKKVAAVRTRIANWEPKRRAAFETDLGKLETSIDQCRQLLQAHPGDQQQEQTMRSLYDEKRQLLNQIEAGN